MYSFSNLTIAEDPGNDCRTTPAPIFKRLQRLQDDPGNDCRTTPAPKEMPCGKCGSQCDKKYVPPEEDCCAEFLGTQDPPAHYCCMCGGLSPICPHCQTEMAALEIRRWLVSIGIPDGDAFSVSQYVTHQHRVPSLDALRTLVIEDHVFEEMFMNVPLGLKPLIKQKLKETYAQPVVMPQMQMWGQGGANV